jgi:hypothetical protein
MSCGNYLLSYHPLLSAPGLTMQGLHDPIYFDSYISSASESEDSGLPFFEAASDTDTALSKADCQTSEERLLKQEHD